jgi:hypothetical protein
MAPNYSTLEQRRIILVAGYDYSHLLTGRKETSFTALCLNRMRMLQARHSSGQEYKFTTEFILFDVRSGRLRTATPTQSGYRWKTVRTFAPVSPHDYVEGPQGRRVFAAPSKGCMSILDVYRYIQDLGRIYGPTILELSFFCHGWVGGICLVNTDESPTFRTSLERDPEDNDSRRKDFLAPAMAPEALQDFRDAFHPQGRAWIWSCAVNASSSDILSQLVGRNEPCPEPDSKLPDRPFTTYRFRFSRPQAKHYFHVDETFFPPDWQRSGRDITFSRTFEDIEGFLQRRLNDTYAKRLAVASGVVCYGALSGTYAAWEQTAHLPLMIVPRNKPPYYDDFSSYLGFYTRWLGLRLDPEGRGFGAFDPSEAAGPPPEGAARVRLPRTSSWRGRHVRKSSGSPSGSSGSRAPSEA